MLGPDVVANYEIGAKLSRSPTSIGAWRADADLPRLQQLYKEYDLVIGPTVGFSPFPWKQLYIDEMDGKKLRNYYHWMATKYFVTLTSNPSVSLPCGIDHKCRSACR